MWQEKCVMQLYFSKYKRLSQKGILGKIVLSLKLVVYPRHLKKEISIAVSSLTKCGIYV